LPAVSGWTQMLDALIHTFAVNIRDIRYLVSNTPSPPAAASVPRRVYARHEITTHC
jgi:hypothetical protein